MNKIIALILTLTITMLSFCSCKMGASRTFFSMDTVVTVEVSSEEIVEKIVKSTNEIDRALSFHSEESELNKLNVLRTINNSPILVDCLKKAYNYGKKTNGAFNVALGQITSLYDFEKEIAPTEEYVSTLIDTINPENIIIKENTVFLKNATLIDLGGIAKGYALEKAIEILKQENQTNAYLNFGGSIYYLSDSFKSVGIKKPFTDNEIAAELLIKNMAVTTAGNYERCFTKDGKLYHHILDSKTGLPVNNGVNSVTVISSSAVAGDVYSTALFVMGYDEGVKYANDNDIAAVFVMADGSVKITNNLKYNKNQQIVLK